MQRSLIARLTALVAVAGLILTGCTGNDRAGGNADAAVTTLTLGNSNEGPPAQLTAFVDNVNKLSHGQLKIEFENSIYHGEADFETKLVKDVKTGSLDLAWVGPRIFDTIGVKSFQPLLAPLLVDSQDLQGKVFAAGIPDQMLVDVTKVGVVGVGVLPGPLRRPMSKSEPLTSPASFKGKRVGTQPSALAEASYAALGATAVGLGSGASIDKVDAYDPQIGVLWGNHYEEHGAKNVVGNLNLWPRPLAIIASPRVWESLTPTQQATLRDAANVSQAPALDASRAEDVDGVADLCKAGIKMPASTPAELAKFEKAFRPVYDSIAATSPANKKWLDQLRELKDTASAPPDTVLCAEVASVAPSYSPGLLADGTYHSLRTATDWSGCSLVSQPSTYRSLLELVVNGNEIRQYEYQGDAPTGNRELGFAATYRVYRGKFEMLETGTSAPLVFDYTFDGKSLSLAHLQHQPNIESEYCIHNTVWTAHPWELQGASQSRAAIPENVSFFSELTTADTAACPDGVDEPETNEIVFRDGLVYLYNIPNRSKKRNLGFKDSYTVYRDKLTVGSYTVTWKLNGKTLVLSDLTGGGCGDKVIWTSHPWTSK